MTGPPDRGITVVVLAGGAASRLGRDKALEPVGGRPMLVRVVEALHGIAEDVVIVGDRSARKGLELPRDVRWTVDRYPDGRGPLAGLHAGASRAKHEVLLAVGCDMPFLNPIVFAVLVYALESGPYEAVIPRVKGLPQPLHAVYQRGPVIERSARLLDNPDGRSGIRDLIRLLRVRYLDEDELTPFDPDLRSFRSVDTQDDLDRVRALIGESS
jgi:molybdopterin-guanine dinucleotide biosynthesis protein A